MDAIDQKIRNHENYVLKGERDRALARVQEVEKEYSEYTRQARREIDALQARLETVTKERDERTREVDSIREAASPLRVLTSMKRTDVRRLSTTQLDAVFRVLERMDGIAVAPPFLSDLKIGGYTWRTVAFRVQSDSTFLTKLELVRDGETTGIVLEHEVYPTHPVWHRWRASTNRITVAWGDTSEDAIARLEKAVGGPLGVTA